MGRATVVGDPNTDEDACRWRRGGGRDCRRWRSGDTALIVRPDAVCKTTIPDDPDDDPITGEAIQLGRPVAQVLADGLRVRGREVTDLIYLGLNGWRCVVFSPRNGICIDVGFFDVGSAIVSVTYMPRFYDRLIGRKDPMYREVLRDVDAILQADARFSDVRWYANGAEGPSADHPIG